MVVGVSALIIFSVLAAVAHEWRSHQNTRAFLHECYDQAYQMGAFGFDEQGNPLLLEDEHENKA